MELDLSQFEWFDRIVERVGSPSSIEKRELYKQFYKTLGVDDFTGRSRERIKQALGTLVYEFVRTPYRPSTQYLLEGILIPLSPLLGMNSREVEMIEERYHEGVKKQRVHALG